MAMAVWIVSCWLWEARLAVFSDTCGSLPAEAGLSGQVWTDDEPLAAEAFLISPNATVGPRSLKGLVLQHVGRAGGGPSSSRASSCPRLQARTPTDSGSLPLAALVGEGTLGALSLLQEQLRILLVLSWGPGAWSRVTRESSRPTPRGALAFPWDSAAQTPLSPECVGAGRAAVTLRVLFWGAGAGAEQRREALEGAEVPREAQLACPRACWRIRSRSRSSLGSLFLGGFCEPSTRGGRSSQGPWGGT